MGDKAHFPVLTSDEIVKRIRLGRARQATRTERTRAQIPPQFLLNIPTTKRENKTLHPDSPAGSL